MRILPRLSKDEIEIYNLIYTYYIMNIEYVFMKYGTKLSASSIFISLQNKGYITIKENSYSYTLYLTNPNIKF